MIYTPQNTAELATTLRSLNEAGKRVRIIGGGTKQQWGNAITTDVAISTAGLSQLREHIWQDMTCTVDAGMKWADLQHALAQHGQRVALDPLFADRATVGGVVATNDSGTLRMKYGSLRDLVIGMTIVLSDGTVARSGGKVVKNVAGYDLPKLMIGAFGTLGIITEVTFRLHAVPRHTRHFTLTDDVATLAQALLRLNASQLSLEALQLRAAPSGAVLDVALSAMPEVLEQQRSTLTGFVESDVSVWQARESLFANALVFKASVLPSDIGSISERIRDLGGSVVVQSTGLITATLPEAGSVPALRAVLEAQQGSLVVLQHEGALDVFGAAPDSLPLQRAIKYRFDPTNTLNPGIFLGGI